MLSVRGKLFPAALLFLLIAFGMISCGQSAEKARQTAFARGKQLYQKADYKAAAIEFQKAIQKDPNFGEAWLWLGRTSEQLENSDGAADAFRQAVPLMPGSDEPLAELGNVLVVEYTGNPRHPAAYFKEASSAADQLIQRNAQSFDGIKLRGFLAAAENDPARAIPLLEQAHQMRPNEAGVVTALFDNLVRSGQTNEAEKLALDFLKQKPDYGPLYTILGQYYVRAKRIGDAEAILKTRIAKNPESNLYRIELARFYTKAGRGVDARAVLDAMIADPKRFPKAHLDAGDFYVEGRQWAEARSEFNLGEQSDPKSGTLYAKRLLAVALTTKDSASAAQLLDRILKQDPNDHDSAAARADLQMASGDPAKKALAMDTFRKLVEAMPENARYHYEYAEALRAGGQNDPAAAQYLLAVQRQPANIPALENLAELSIRRQALDDAITYADRALALNPSDARMSLVKSAALAAKGRFDETRSILRGVETQNPRLRDTQLQLALLDVEQKHYSQAEARFRKYYVGGKGDVKALEGLIAIYRAQRQLDQALTLLRQDLEKGPQYDSVRLLLAEVAHESGNNDLAIEQYRRLEQSQPKAPAIAIQLGVVCQEKGDLKCAIGEFERAKTLAPETAAVWGYLGKALEDVGRPAEAIASYQKSLELDKRNPWVMNNLAFLLADKGERLDDALKLASDALRLNPASASFSDTLGWVYLKKKDFQSALHLFQGARDKDPDAAAYRMHLGEALLATGNRTRGRSELEAALKLTGNQEERNTIAQLLRDNN
ncbi:MAG TPA: tetratricopeptide repeat protein [Bryobacteraceae bacterium]|jgi:tetratricopeptide (TPR) repeat protein|nr:tetratricopeptide repeat protein [Bryobacteraceae bacterium]